MPADRNLGSVEHFRLAFVPRGGLLVRMGKPQHTRLAPVRTDDLQPDGESGLGEAAGNRDGRQSPYVYRASIAQQQNFTRAQEVGVLR